MPQTTHQCTAHKTQKGMIALINSQLGEELRLETNLVPSTLVFKYDLEFDYGPVLEFVNWHAVHLTSFSALAVTLVCQWTQ